MTPDEPDKQLDPASPADEARIRALLSGARETGPMPADVVARLDGALVGLASERISVDPIPADNVIPITRTRRHRVVTILGAAAAVGVFGLGVNAVLNGESGGDDAGTSADSAVVNRGDDERAQEGANDVPTPDHRDETTGISPETGDYLEGDRAFVVRPRQLSQDLTQLQSLVLDVPAEADYDQALVYAPQGFSCRLATPGRGVLVGVRYDGRPAFVRFLEPMGDSQIVEVVQCRTGDLLRSTTLPTDD